MNQESRIKNSNRSKDRQESGFSIIEMLIALTLFAVVFVVATQSLATSLKNSRKSDSLSKARENVDYAMSTMERLLRNAQSIDLPSCTNSQLVYVDEYGNSTNLSCLPAGSTTGYIASGSAAVRLTSNSVVVDCSGVTFSCPPPAPGVPESVFITVKVREANLGSSVEGAEVTQKTKIQLRNYTVFCSC